MAEKHSIILNSTDYRGNKNQKTITDINPAATGAVLKAFAQQLNALTTNEYKSTTRVGREPLVSANSLIATTVSWPTSTRNDPAGGTIDANDSSKLTIPFSAIAETNGQEAMANTRVLRLTADVEMPTPQVKSTPTYGSARVIASNTANEFYVVYYLPAAAYTVPDCKAGCLGEYVFYIPQSGDYAAVTATLTITDD